MGFTAKKMNPSLLVNVRDKAVAQICTKLLNEQWVARIWRNGAEMQFLVKSENATRRAKLHGTSPKISSPNFSFSSLRTRMWPTGVLLQGFISWVQLSTI